MWHYTKDKAQNTHTHINVINKYSIHNTIEVKEVEKTNNRRSIDLESNSETLIIGMNLVTGPSGA